jgi:hypothetical protein
MKRAFFALAAASVLLAAPAPARAFCGFYVAPSDAPLYNDATQVALVRGGNRTVMSMSNNYRGPAADFAMVVPVPVVLKEADVKTLSRDVFERLEKQSAPRLVEYWEQDPCADPGWGNGIGLGTVGGFGHGAGMGYGSGSGAEYKVKVEAQFAVGEYQIVILSAEQSDGLERWLRDNKYNVPKGAAEALAPYIKEQQKFFVAKVDVSKVKLDDKGVATLSPLRFSYESSDFKLPVRLGLINASATPQDLIVYVLSPDTRYEVANYTNATIPTNLDVNDATRGAFGSFYATLFDATVAKAGGKAVVTEYAWGSNTCDPCPIPPVGDQDLATLGADIVTPGSVRKATKLIETTADIQGRLPPEVIKRIIRANYPRFRACYESGLKRVPDLKGTVSTAFVIDKDGAVESAKNTGGTLTDEPVKSCVTGVFKTLSFPEPEGGKVKVTYPIDFQVGDDPSRPVRSATMVLTRLHTRYDKATLGEDLVFRAASPIEGGREVWAHGVGDKIEQGAKASGVNNFQARYAIRHPWTGKIECKEPHRGRWGGPPTGTTQPEPAAATQLAGQSRGVKLASYVQSGLDDVASWDGAAAQAMKGPAAASATPSASAAPSASASPAKKSCGCEVPGGAREAGGGAAIGLTLLALVRRRARKA